MIDRKELGMKTGKGFYTYPGPEWAKPNFLKGGIDG
jgi:3-hydroxybutyryl-CoA dehydrogenase